MSVRNFFQNIARLARSDGVTTFSSSDVTAMMANLGSTSAALNVAGSTRPAENVIMVLACIQCRRDAIGGQTPMLTVGNDDAPIDAGPVRELLDKPNGAQDFDQFVRQLETHQTLHNVCACHLLRDPSRPEITPLQPEGLRPRLGVYAPAGTPRVTSWDYTDPTTAEQREFPLDDVVIRMGYNPHAPLSSLSPTGVLARTIKGDLAAREQNLGLFLNDATPRGYLHTDQGMNKDQAMQVLDVWNSAHQGYLNRHKTAAMWGGMKYDRIQLSPAELEFLQSLRQMRIDYYMAFRVYPAMLAEMTGETGLSQGSSTGEQRLAWWEDIGTSELKLIAGLVTECFQRLGLAGDVWYNDAQIPALARQRLGKVDTAAKLLAAGYRPDDVNDYLDLGLPKHPDNSPRIAFSLQEIGAGKGQSAEGKEQSAEGKEPSEKGEDPKAEAALARVEELLLTRAGTAPADPGRSARLDALEKRTAKKWSRFFLEQRGRVLKRLESLTRSDQLARAANEPASLAFTAFPREAEDTALALRLTPTIVEGLLAGAEDFAKRTGIANPFTVDSPNARKAIEKRKIQCLKVNDTTETDIRGIFAKGFDEGATIPEMADRIAEYYAERCEGFDSDRALNAARTQTTGIVNDGELLAAREAGGLKKYWTHAESSKDDRETHVAAAAKYGAANAIGLDEKFDVGGVEMDAPGDPDAGPEEVCNCRCGLGFVKAGNA